MSMYKSLDCKKLIKKRLTKGMKEGVEKNSQDVQEETVSGSEELNSVDL